MADSTGSSINPVLQAIIALGGIGAGRLYGNAQQQANVPPELRQLLQQSVQRTAYQQPLAEAQTRGIYSMLPNFAQNGPFQPGTAPAAVSSQGSAGGSGGMNPLLAGLLGAAGGSALTGLADKGSAIPFADIIKGL